MRIISGGAVSTKRFRARHTIVVAVQYDGSAESVQRLRELLPDVDINARIGVGDMLQLDGDELLKRGVWIARTRDGRFRVFEPEVFEDIYEIEQE
jgi:hypothetical protein